MVRVVGGGGKGREGFLKEATRVSPQRPEECIGAGHAAGGMAKVLKGLRKVWTMGAHAVVGHEKGLEG